MLNDIEPRIYLNPYAADATYVQSTWTQKKLKTIKILSCWYSLDSFCSALSDEYPFARVSVIFPVFRVILYGPNSPPAALGLKSLQLRVPTKALQ